MVRHDRRGKTLFEQLRRRVYDLLYTECPPTEAPTFAPTLPRAEKPCISNIQISAGAVVINGVALPQNVLDQLRQLGVPLAAYNHGELQDAVQACAWDGKLFEDEDGISMSEKLHFTDEKKMVQELRRLAAQVGQPVRVLTMRTLGIAGWAMPPPDIHDQVASLRAEFAGMLGAEPIPCSH